METSNHLTRRTRQSPPGIFVPRIRCAPRVETKSPRVVAQFLIPHSRKDGGLGWTDRETAPLLRRVPD
nr:MAG TPA: hypothetical protein [Caudoviricetes sp.]